MMAAAAAATTTTTTAHHHLQLKLVVDPKARRVLFAEATGEAIKFLHSLLFSPHVSLPFNGATRYACIGNVYHSVGKLRAFAVAANISRGLPPFTVRREEERFFVCGGGDGNGSGGASSCGGYVTDKSGARCPSCGGEMALEVPRGCPGASCSDAYAEPGVMGLDDLTCMLMDDLNVMQSPASAFLSIARVYRNMWPEDTSLMMGCVVPGILQETVVCLGYTEAMEILKTSLQSSTVLTDVFLRKKKKARPFGKSPQ